MKAQISKIKVINRIRKEITKIDELAADISANGLLNAITVMSLGNGEYQLLAGLRRLKAVEMLGHSEIAVNIVSPADAEAALRIEISENEQREPFTFSEQVDYGRMLEEIEKAKALQRKSAGGKGGLSEDVFHGTHLQKGRSRDIVGSKIGLSGTQYDRAKYIAENAPSEVIDELDQGKRNIRPTYDELRAKEKAEKANERAIQLDSAENHMAADDTIIVDYEDNDDDTEEVNEPISTDGADEGDYKKNEITDVPELVFDPSAQNPGKLSTAEIALGMTNRRSQENSKEYREDLRQIRDSVNKMAEYSRNHKRTIEEFQQVFKANTESLVDSIEHQIKFMDAEIWKDPNNKQIACGLLDELVQAIFNFKEEFLYGNYE